MIDSLIVGGAFIVTKSYSSLMYEPSKEKDSRQAGSKLTVQEYSSVLDEGPMKSKVDKSSSFSTISKQES